MQKLLSMLQVTLVCVIHWVSRLCNQPQAYEARKFYTSGTVTRMRDSS